MDSSRPTRREFAVSLAAAGCASLVAACARPQPRVTQPTAPSPAVPPAQGDSTRAPAARDATGGDAERLLGVVERRYAATFPAGNRGDVRGGVVRALQLGEALRRVPVVNAADPFTTCGVAAGVAAGRRAP